MAWQNKRKNLRNMLAAALTHVRNTHNSIDAGDNKGF